MPIDPRTDPNSYGPQQASQPIGVRPPLTDNVAGIRDALSSLDPEMAHLINSIGSVTKKRASGDTLLQQGYQGMTVSDLQGVVDSADAAEKAMQLASQSMEMSDKDFASVFSQLEGEMSGMPALPERGQVQQPGHLEQGLAALLSLGSPEHAFDIGAVPYQNEQRKVEEQYQLDVQRYGQEMAKRGERIKLTEMRLKLAENRRSEAIQRVQQLQDAAIKRGDQKEALGYKMREELYGAKTLPELSDRVSAMREAGLSQYLPDQKTIDAMKASIQAEEQAKTDKIEFDQKKEEADRVISVINDFQGWIDDFRPSDRAIVPADVEAMRKQARQWAKDNNVPEARLLGMVPGERDVSPSTDLSQRRYDEGATARGYDEEYGRLRNIKLEGEIEKLRNAPPKDKADKAKKLKEMGEQINLARAKSDAFARTKPKGWMNSLSPEWRAKMDKLIEEEYELVAKKRFVSEGQYPTLDEYMESQGKRFGQQIGKGPVAPAPVTQTRPGTPAAPPAGFTMRTKGRED